MLRRIDFERTQVEIACSGCPNPIKVGKPCVVIVRSNLVVVFPKDENGDEFEAKLFDDEVAPRVNFVPGKAPLVDVQLYLPGGARLKEPVEITYHHLHNCGVNNRIPRRAPGSFEMGKRR